MSDKQIRDTLKRLHEALQSQPELDPELKSLLHTLERDIQNALQQAPQQPPGDLSTQAQALAARFAVKHPHIDLMLQELRSLLLGLGL